MARRSHTEITRPKRIDNARISPCSMTSDLSTPPRLAPSAILSATSRRRDHARTTNNDATSPQAISKRMPAPQRRATTEVLWPPWRSSFRLIARADTSPAGRDPRTAFSACSDADVMLAFGDSLASIRRKRLLSKLRFQCIKPIGSRNSGCWF